jgi:hypothetical protein
VFGQRQTKTEARVRWEIVRACTNAVTTARGTGCHSANIQISIRAYCDMPFRGTLWRCAVVGARVDNWGTRHSTRRSLALASPYGATSGAARGDGGTTALTGNTILVANGTFKKPNSIHCLQPCLRVSAILGVTGPGSCRRNQGMPAICTKRSELSLPKRLNSPQENHVRRGTLQTQSRS